MPGYIIHLSEGRMIENFLKERGWKLDREEFYNGILLPDSVEKRFKSVSHFWSEKDKGYIVRTPDLQLFYDKYETNISNSFILGYLAHLDLDQKFFNAFFDSKFLFKDRHGNETFQISEVTDVCIRESGEKIPVTEFFGGEYLYKDYTILNSILIEKYHLEEILKMLQQSRFDQEIYESLIPEAESGDLQEVYQKLDLFIRQGKNLSDARMKVLTEADICLFLKNTAEKLINRV